MRAYVKVPVALVALLALSAAPCSASQGRWSLALGGGKTPPLINGFGGRGLVTMSAFRSLTDHLSLQARATYLWPYSESHVAPVGIGVRIFADPHPSRQSGLFLEATPSLFISRWSDARGSLTAAMPGYQVGGGFQIPAFDNAGVEIGALYLRSRDFGSHGGTNERGVSLSATHPGLDEMEFHAAVVMGL